MYITREDTIKWAVKEYWSKIMTNYKGSMPDNFKSVWVQDVFDTADIEFNDDDIEMAFQRTVMRFVNEGNNHD